ncbi:hypothetical protein LSTR_LSTR002681 [Laodelphax striatellus]|uniref:SUN domain-containing protein n=1 Tax=Laodelphax striatellus TaxID=195883 RepID=A0A482X5A7_LAOST|nr:hypothetical protein LSTR_LSTR002681 [Laodelphax striatellus]
MVVSTEALLIDSCNEPRKVAAQSLVLQDMAQLQAKVETLEKIKCSKNCTVQCLTTLWKLLEAVSSKLQTHKRTLHLEKYQIFGFDFGNKYFSSSSHNSAVTYGQIMTTRRLTMGLRNERVQPPCLNLSKLRKRTKFKYRAENTANSSKEDQSPCGSNFSDCSGSDTAVISFGCDRSPSSTPETKKDRLKGHGDAKEFVENSEHPCDSEAPLLKSKVNKIEQETQTDVPRKSNRLKIGIGLILLSVFFCCIQNDFLDILKDLHDEYFSRSYPTEALLIDSCNEPEKVAAQSLVLQDMAQLQAKVETLEKALVLLQQPKAMQRNIAADKMLEQLYGPMPDYALEATGGSIIETPNTQTYSSSGTISIFGFDFWKQVTSHPRLIIQGLIQPGECWSFKGPVGSVVIQLSRQIKVTSITLEHFPDYLLPTGSPTLSAPKIFSVIAVPDCDDCKLKHLGLFEYSLFGPARQTFIISREIFESMPAVKIIEIHFTANHGNPIYTCVYRVRIHGEPHND